MNIHGKKAPLVFAGVLLILGGLFLLYAAYLSPGKFPYTYVLVQTGTLQQFPQFSELTPYGSKNPSIKKYELRLTEDNALVSTFHTLTGDGTSPVIIEYKTEGSLPILRLPVRAETFHELSKAIREHTREDAVIVAWWDHSLRIRSFTGRAVLFRDVLGEPIFVPDGWRKHRKAISDTERRFWGINLAKEARETFEKVLEAMLAPEEQAHGILKKLAGNKPTYVVVDQSDILKLSESSGHRFRIEFEDFPFSGDMHGIIKRVKDRLKQKEQSDYAVEQVSENTVRVYYLTRAEDRDKLMVRLLPFTSSNPFGLIHFKLRFQTSTIWVYELS